MNVKPKTALVLCGGGAPGTTENGFYQAMMEYEVKPGFYPRYFNRSHK